MCGGIIQSSSPLRLALESGQERQAGKFGLVPEPVTRRLQFWSRSGCLGRVWIGRDDGP